MSQPKVITEIYRLETILHRMKGDSNKYIERKVILKQLENLSNEFKKGKSNNNK